MSMSTTPSKILHKPFYITGRAASQVLESSGNDIINEVGPPVIKVISTKVVETIRKFFNNVPPEDLALD